MKKVESISVITVCLNCVDTIDLTLSNVRKQTYDQIEHIVIDGGSSDGTISIIETYQVDYFVSEPDDGIYHAMEKGVAAATGDVLIFLNSGDMFYDQQVCEDIISFFNETESDVVFGDFCPFKINIDDSFDHKSFEPDRVCKLSSITDRTCLKNHNIHHQALFYSRKIFDKCSFFSPEWTQGSDYELNVQALVLHGFKAKYINRVVTKFALGGVSTSNYEKEIQLVARLNAIIQQKYFQMPIRYQRNEFISKKSISQYFNVWSLLNRTPPFQMFRRFLHKLVAR